MVIAGGIMELFILQYVSCAAAFIGAIGSIGAIAVALYVHHKAQMPYIIAYLEYYEDENAIYLIVKNMGNGVARNVKISGFDYSMAMSGVIDVLKDGFIEKGIANLVPGAYRKTFINGGYPISQNMWKSSELTVSYDAKGFLRNKTICETFTLDYYSFAGNLYPTSEAQKIIVAIEKIAQEIKNKA